MAENKTYWKSAEQLKGERETINLQKELIELQGDRIKVLSK